MRKRKGGDVLGVDGVIVRRGVVTSRAMQQVAKEGRLKSSSSIFMT
jgi:hypothetical protein